MGYFQDMGVLLLYGMTALLWIKADRSFIFVLLCTVVLLCGKYFFERRLTKILGCVVFAGTSFFIPELVVFYSVMEYLGGGIDRCDHRRNTIDGKYAAAKWIAASFCLWLSACSTFGKKNRKVR